MSREAHTAGPWTFDSRSMTGAVWAGSEFVASVFPNAPDDWDGFSDYAGLEEMRANARLIAAAPALLEACRLALPSNLCVTNTVVSDSTVVSLDATMGDLRKIAAAIHSATGEG